MKKTIEQYMALPYTLEILPTPSEGGWYIRAKELKGCMTQADRWEDVLPMVEDAKRLWLEVAIEREMPIPEPSPEFASE
jgi:predicted RNase H-like HicB family nuclease